MKKQNDASCQVSKTANLIKKAWLIVMFFCITLTGVFAQTVVTVSSSGNFTIPAGVTTIKVEAWGTGGSGGGATGTIGASRGGGGGGGGAYTTNNLTVSAGQIYSITIGAQGSTGTGAGGSGGATIFTGTGGTVTANGGAGGQPTNGAGGAGGAGGTFAGGAGGTGTANNGAGGGGAAGNNAVGGSGTATTAGAGGAGSPNVAPYKGGNGAANQATSGANGLAGISPGGGGGGGRGAAFFGTANGGAGALGQVVITYTAPVCPLTTSISPTADQSGCAGFVSNSLSATVVTSGTTGSSTTQYQWYYNTTNSNTIAGASLIAGANSATYLPLTTSAESGTRYYFCVSYATDNGCGQTNATQYLASNAVKVTVNSPPSSVVSPSTQTICSGTIVTITGTATGIGVGASSTTSTQGSGGSTTTASTTTSTLGPNPFQVYYGGDKQQMLITASELSALGMVSLGASITDWGIFMNAAGSTALSNVTIKMQNTTLTALTTTPVTTGWTTVHTLASFTPTTGVNLLTLTTPFLWNGADNLLIEVNYSNNNTGATTPTNTATYDATAYVSTWFYRADNVTAAAMNTYSGTASFTYSARNRMRFKFKNVVNNIAPTWTASTPTLYSNALATIAYVAGTPAATVYGKPTANTTYTASVDNKGACTVSSTSVITVNTAPTFTVCPSNQSTNATTGLCSKVVNYTATATGTPSPAISYSFSGATTGSGSGTGSGSAFNVGVTNVSITASNSCSPNATCSFTITVADTQNPVISNCPGNINLNNDAGLCTAVATWTAPTATDNCSIQSFTSTHNSGDVFPVGSTTVVYTATDVNGNTATCAFNVVVTDNQNPVISSCPSNISLNNDAGLCTAVATWTAPTAADNCNIQSLASTHNSGDAFPMGTTTVTYTATDVNGNTATCSFDVVVTDTEIPVIVNCPANITVNNDAGLCSAIVNYTAPSVTDNCSGSTINGSHNSGDAFPIGTTTVTYTATDAHGNSAVACSFDITVNSTAPDAPTSLTTNAPFDNICNGNNVILTANGGSLGSMGGDYKWYTGSCGGTLVGTGVSITQSPAVTTTYFARIEDNCGNITSCASVTVTLSYTPDSANVILPFSGMPANVCTGTTANLSIASVAGATQYIWDVPSGGYFNGNVNNVSPFVTGTPNVQVTFGSPVGSMYTIGVQAGNACGNSIRKTQKVRGTTSVPAAVNGPLTACANSSISYSTGAVVGATSYLWTITGDATISGSGTTVTVNFGPAWNGGNLCVASQTTCYTSANKCITISKSSAALGAISGTFTACPNSAGTFTVAPVAGAASYTWTSPANSSVSGGQGTNNATVSYAPGYNAVGNICVTVTSICGVTTAPKCKSVAPGLPAQPASIAGPVNGLCGQSVVYSCPSQGMGVTYTWTVPAGATLVSGQGSNSISVNYGTFSTGSVCVKANTTCGSSATRCIGVKGAPGSPAAITATPSSWCANTAGIEFNVNVAGLSGSYALSWTYPATPVATYISGAGNSSQLIMDWGTGTGNINVTASNVCGSATKTSTWTSSCREGELSSAKTFTVYPNPSTGMINVDFTAEKGNSEINVVDVTGRIVFTRNLKSLGETISLPLNLSGLSKGSYLLRITNEGNVKQSRITLQ